MNLLNIANIKHRSQVNGPGLRSVVWVQGCTLKCPGCFNAHTHAHQAVKLVDPEELGQTLTEITDTEGVTISGGEPFQQAAACAILAETLQKSDRSVMVFTWYPYDHIENSTEDQIKAFLNHIDLLVAGPFMQKLCCHEPLRASRNQQVIFRTDRLRQAVRHTPTHTPLAEMTADGDSLSFTGFPDPKDLKWLKQICQTS